MAAEPEKKIEELLKSYSRKRREDAGAPLEMHPATRRMLQGEVTREHGKPGGASSASPRPWWKALLLFGPKYAGALGMFAILALGVWIITQQDRQSARVLQEASDRHAGADADPARPLGELAQRETEKLKEVDDLARASSTSKEGENKKAELSKGRGVFLEQQKVQMRDADGPPVAAAPTPAAPQSKLTEELMREKQVPLQNEPQVGQRIANVVAGGAGLSADKNSAGLADKPGPPEEFYKRTEAKADALGVPPPATQPITARLDLAAAKSAPTNYYAYTVIVPANVMRGAEATTALYAGVELATTTNARGEKLLAFGGAATPGATEWAAVPAEQPAKNEVERTRELQPLTRVAQEAESREGISPVLLRRFSVEQNNNTIRIRDAEDGSIYVGEMLATSEPNVDAKAKEAKDEFRQLRRNAEDPRSGGVTFQARGFNQRSKQVVIINGELTEEQERSGEFAGKSIAGVSGATAPAPTSTPARPADALSLGRRDQAAAGDRQSQVQTGTTFRSTPAPGLAASTSATAPSTSTVFRATTLRARVRIGETNELNFRAIRTR
jgi:hypothetical protein